METKGYDMKIKLILDFEGLLTIAKIEWDCSVVEKKMKEN